MAAIYEVMLATAFTLLPFVAFMLADQPNGFRLVGLPGGVTLFIAPVLVWFLIPESPRWLLRRGRVQDAVDAVNLVIRRCGSRVPPMTVAELGSARDGQREALPSFWKLFAPGQVQWTAVAILCGICGGTGYYLIAILLPKALVDQGAAVAVSFGLSSLVFAASIPGKLFNGYIMEVIGRRWTITGSFALAIPGLLLMMLAHRMGSAATIVFEVGTLITGFTVLSCFPAVRMYLSGAVPDGAARARALLRRIVRPHIRRRDRAVPDGLVYRLAGDILRHDGRRGRGRRLHPADVRPGDLGQPRGLHRDGARAGVIAAINLDQSSTAKTRSDCAG